MKTLFAIAATAATALTVAAAAAPASAEPLAPRPTTEAAAQDGVPAPTVADPKQRICFVNDVTGSRIPARVCQTRARWQAMGQPLPAGL